MLGPYVKFSEAEQRFIKKWQLVMVACYGSFFLALVASAIVNQAVSNWAAHATQAEMTAPHANPATDQTQMTLGWLY